MNTTERYIHEAASGGDWPSWVARRRFIASAIHRPGSFLDIGCANGFFLKCLHEEWSPHAIVPFGIDNREEAISAARALFPVMPQHFALLSGDQLERLSASGLPEQFDFVFRSYWSSQDIQSSRLGQIISNLRRHVLPDGRIIVALYGSNMHRADPRAHAAEREKLIRSLAILQSQADFSSPIWADDGYNNVMMYVEM